jgi:hypothetical protein
MFVLEKENAIFEMKGILKELISTHTLLSK